MVTIEASILSADFARLGEQACAAETAGVDAIQVDVMDGRFVSDITFGPGVARALRALRRMLVDRNMDTPITLDGGLDSTTAALAVSAGAAVLVVGSSIYNDKGSVADNVAALRASIL